MARFTVAILGSAALVFPVMVLVVSGLPQESPFGGILGVMFGVLTLALAHAATMRSDRTPSSIDRI